jgi:hypothetical protein
VPNVALPPAMPLTFHERAGAGFPVAEIVAVKTCSPAAGTFALRGVRVTTTSSFSVIVTDALAEALAALTAVIVAVAGFGKTEGAVYVPLDEI